MKARTLRLIAAGLALAALTSAARADGVGSHDTSGVIGHRDGTVSSGSVSDASPHRDSIVVVPQTMSADVEMRRQPAINIYVDPGSAAAGAGPDASEGESPDDRRPRRHRRRDR